jgi:hypothetical protein
MDPRKIFGKAKGQQEDQSGRKAYPLSPFALSVIVPNKCEHRNNLPRIHRLLMHIQGEKDHHGSLDFS